MRIPKKSRSLVIVTAAAFSLLLLSNRTRAQDHERVEAPKFQVDPFWIKPLPDRWVTGDVSGTCVDAQDHLFITNRGNLYPKEKNIATPAPPVLEFDANGQMVNSWGDWAVVPKTLHGCFVDYQGNVWIAGNEDAIVQKYSHDGKLLLQIGTKGLFDTSDGTIGGAPMNSSHTLLNGPADVAVDPTNGDIYIADGYGNRRIVVFDKTGHFLRQWGRQGNKAEIDAGLSGMFLKVVHCVVIGNDGLVYVGDRSGDRVEVFDKMGNFKRHILIESKTATLTGAGSVSWICFSPDPAQKFMYVANSGDEEVRVLERATGKALYTFGRPGLQTGEFNGLHTMAVNSKGDIITGEANVYPAGGGRRVQVFKLVKD